MSRARRSESGVTLLEMLVVLVIIAILIGLLVSNMGGSKDTASKAAGRQVARAYYETAVDFASDNGGAVPRPGTTDWPTSRPELGPVNFLNKTAQQRYLRNVPEAVTDGRARLVTTGGGSTGSTGAPLRITYTRTGAQSFEIVAALRGTPFCRLANGPSTTALKDC